MTAVAIPQTPPAPRPSKRPLNLAEWLHSIGDVPAERVLLNPPPGTVTLEQYVRLDGRVNERLVELVDNTLVEKPMGLLLGALVAVVVRHVGNFVRQHRLGLAASRGMIRMSSGNVRIPHVCFIANADLDREKLRTEAAPQFAPTLAVEIISEGNTPAEMGKKLEEYFQSGCRLAWLLYPPTQTLRVYVAPQSFRQLTAEDTVDGGDVLPGFSVKICELFEV